MNKIFLDSFQEEVGRYMEPYLEPGEVIKKYTICVPIRVPLGVPVLFLFFGLFPALTELIISVFPSIKDNLPDHTQEKLDEPIVGSTLLCLTDRRLISSRVILGNKVLNPVKENNQVHSYRCSLACSLFLNHILIYITLEFVFK